MLGLHFELSGFGSGIAGGFPVTSSIIFCPSHTEQGSGSDVAYGGGICEPSPSHAGHFCQLIALLLHLVLRVGGNSRSRDRIDFPTVFVTLITAPTNHGF